MLRLEAFANLSNSFHCRHGFTDADGPVNSAPSMAATQASALGEVDACIARRRSSAIGRKHHPGLEKYGLDRGRAARRRGRGPGAR
ncbi:hypothetical protein D9M73_267270 [compost metagenome]